MRLLNEDHTILQKFIEKGLEFSRACEDMDAVTQGAILHARRLTNRHRGEDPTWPLVHEPSGTSYDTQGKTDELADLVVRHRVGTCVDAAGRSWRPRAFIVWEPVDSAPGVPGGPAAEPASTTTTTRASAELVLPTAPAPAEATPYAD